MKKLLVVGMMFLMGCVTSPGAFETHTPTPEQNIYVCVSNLTDDYLRVGTDQTPGRTRVESMTSKWLIIPGGLGVGRDIQLIADPVGGSEDHFTYPTTMQAGERWQWEVQMTRSMSMINLKKVYQETPCGAIQ